MVPQSRFIAAVDPVIARAREMQKMTYDAAKEGEVKAPNYVGWDKEIDDDFKKLTVGPVKGGRPYGKICDSALDLIGFTPMVRMSRFAKFFDVDCDLLAKVELFNAGGSVKDRIAKRMVEEAEKRLGVQLWVCRKLRRVVSIEHVMQVARDGQGNLLRLMFHGQLPYGEANDMLVELARAKFSRGTKVSIMEPLLQISPEGLLGIEIGPGEASAVES
ncbi:CBS [Symbiodinium microadriaticum]|nr:CBS [Symbiodinium microadriaticum]